MFATPRRHWPSCTFASWQSARSVDSRWSRWSGCVCTRGRQHADQHPTGAISITRHPEFSGGCPSCRNHEQFIVQLHARQSSATRVCVCLRAWRPRTGLWTPPHPARSLTRPERPPGPAHAHSWPRRHHLIHCTLPQFSCCKYWFLHVVLTTRKPEEGPRVGNYFSIRRVTRRMESWLPIRLITFSGTTESSPRRWWSVLFLFLTFEFWHQTDMIVFIEKKKKKGAGYFLEMHPFCCDIYRNCDILRYLSKFCDSYRKICAFAINIAIRHRCHLFDKYR